VSNAGDPGLEQERQVVLQMPVLDDAIGAHMLDFERDEIDRLPLALDAVERSGEVPGKAERAAWPELGIRWYDSSPWLSSSITRPCWPDTWVS
jgi:hypothetical protein